MAARRSSRVPKSLLGLGVPVAGILLTGFFLYRGFPYERLGERAAAYGRQAGFEVTFQDIAPRLSIAGPGLEATGVRVAGRSAAPWPVDRALVRPAWSLSWLKGQPAVFSEVETPMGAATGTVTLGGDTAWNGDLAAVDLARLPLGEAAGMLRGTADARLDLTFTESGPVGPVEFEAVDGSLTLPEVAMPVPYEKLTGQLLLGDGNYAQIESLLLEGPLLTASITGTVGRAPTLGAAPLRLEAKISAQPALVPALKSLGLRVSRDGKATIRVAGTVSRPQYR